MGTRTHFHQSCALNPVCTTAPVTSTGEIILPAATRALRTVETVRGLMTVFRFLTEAERERAEAILVQCVKEADFKVNEYLFGKGKSLPDSDCKKPPTVANADAETWAQHLGDLKHAAAFACVQTRFAEEFPNNFAIEPRYRGDSLPRDVVLTDWKKGSLQPDVVLHFTRNATRIQCVYELKFPCGLNERRNPLSNPAILAQLRAYQDLGTKDCLPAVITPGLELSRSSSPL
jgi:hypothetical protein